MSKSKKSQTNSTSLHPKTHQLMAKALAAKTDASFLATLARLVLLLESYGKMNPVIPSTPVGAAAYDVDILAADINERWNFPPGKKYRSGDIVGTTITQVQARDIDNRGGVLNGR